jgi:cyclopropane-fatty-acyl-phospholipid synthase
VQNSVQHWLEEILVLADVRIDGDRPWDIRVKDESLAQRILAQGGNLGLGEAYMDGVWECDAMDELFTRLLAAQIDQKVRPTIELLAHAALARLVNLQNRHRSKTVAEIHYDLGNDFYEAMLDPWMQYTCAYWRNGAKNLEEAQEAKLDLICRKLDLKPGQRVLELGCGWGGFARYAATRYGVEVVGYNISQEQVAWARERCKGLSVEIRQADYRDADGVFDKAVSVGMCEHVGWKNHRSFVKLVHDRLKPGGVFLLHTIGGVKAAFDMEPWLDKYIFPGSSLPSPAQLGKAIDGLFVLEDWHNFGTDYDRTLMEWKARFEASWPRFSERYGERFRRMWTYYLTCCAGTFRSRHCQLYQLTLSKGGVPGGWKSVR